MKNSTCFISYSWDNDEHKDWVRVLATELQHKGIETKLDQWDCHLGMDLTKYMETCVRESDFVLLICTPKFCQKANTGQGGVGYEKNIVTGEIFEGVASPKKFVPLLRKGSTEESLPSYLKSKNFIDFRNDSIFESELETLLRHLYESPKYVRPPLGQKPNLPTHENNRLKIPTLPNEIHPHATFQLFQQVFKFARDPNGLNYAYPGDAESYAKEWIEQFSDKDFQFFKEIFEFARDPNGLNYAYPSDAETYAKEWIEQFSDKDFQFFKEMFEFARDPNGLNYAYPSDAETYAKECISKRNY